MYLYRETLSKYGSIIAMGVHYAILETTTFLCSFKFFQNKKIWEKINASSSQTISTIQRIKLRKRTV